VPGPSPSRSYKERDLKLLWGLAAARCSNPDCRKPLIKEATESDPHAVLGKIAHINDFSPCPDSPRSDPSLTIQQLNAYGNLILLCGDHHDEIDKQKRTFPRETLLRWKREHEAWVDSRLEQATPGVGFAELQVVCEALLAAAAQPSDQFIPTPPAEKMRKNGLSARLLRKLQLGLSTQVATFERLVLGLDLLYLMGVVELDGGVIRRVGR
jgi:hypothetical protein